MTTGNKYNKDKLFARIEHGAVSGVVGKDEYECFGEVILRVTTTFATSGVLTVQGRIFYSDSWEDIGTMQFDGDTDTFDIATYDYVRFNFTTTAGSSGEVAASGFFKDSSAAAADGVGFNLIQPDSGTSPQADSSGTTLTLTSSDSSLVIEGDATTDTIDIRSLAVTSPAGSNGEIQFNDSGSFGADPNLTYSSSTLSVKASAGQVTNISEWKDSTGDALLSVKPTGELVGLNSAGQQTFRINGYSGGNAGELELGRPGTGGARILFRGIEVLTYYASKIKCSTGMVFGSSNIVDSSYLINLNTSLGDRGIACRAPSSGTTDFFLIRDYATSSKKFVIDSDGCIAINTGASPSGSAIQINSKAASEVGLKIVADASQSANLSEWQDSTSTVLASVSAAGKVKATSLNLSNLPTSSTGLSAGDVWNDAGTLKIV